jgi:hypothetical protein
MLVVDCVWNAMAHAQKPDFVFRRNGQVHLNRQGRQFSRLLAGELCTSACSICTARASLCSAVTWRLLVTNSILLFPLHFSSRASPCAITFQTQSTITYKCSFVRGRMWKTVYSCVCCLLQKNTRLAWSNSKMCCGTYRYITLPNAPHLCDCNTGF